MSAFVHQPLKTHKKEHKHKQTVSASEFEYSSLMSHQDLANCPTRQSLPLFIGSLHGLQPDNKDVHIGYRIYVVQQYDHQDLSTAVAVKLNVET